MSMWLVVIGGLLLVVCSGMNCLYFQQYQKRPVLARRKRVGAMVLSLLSAGTALESSYALALYLLYHGSKDEGFLFGAFSWLAARSLLLIATAAVTGLIVWQEWSGRK